MNTELSEPMLGGSARAGPSSASTKAKSASSVATPDGKVARLTEARYRINMLMVFQSVVSFFVTLVAWCILAGHVCQWHSMALYDPLPPPPYPNGITPTLDLSIVAYAQAGNFTPLIYWQQEGCNDLPLPVGVYPASECSTGEYDPRPSCGSGSSGNGGACTLLSLALPSVIIYSVMGMLVAWWLAERDRAEKPSAQSTSLSRSLARFLLSQFLAMLPRATTVVTATWISRTCATQAFLFVPQTGPLQLFALLGPVIGVGVGMCAIIVICCSDKSGSTYSSGFSIWFGIGILASFICSTILYIEAIVARGLPHFIFPSLASHSLQDIANLGQQINTFGTAVLALAVGTCTMAIHRIIT